MNTNDDQWFEPGDKVMRVFLSTELGLPGVGPPILSSSTVYCVESCDQDADGWNAVTLVGIDDGGLPFYAACFRRVTEIQLCVRAAKRLSSPVETTAETENV